MPQTYSKRRVARRRPEDTCLYYIYEEKKILLLYSLQSYTRVYWIFFFGYWHYTLVVVLVGLVLHKSFFHRMVFLFFLHARIIYLCKLELVKYHIYYTTMPNITISGRFFRLRPPRCAFPFIHFIAYIRIP